MQPQPSLNLIPTVQQAIDSLLTVYEPEFLRFGYHLFLAFATILIAWQGIRMMFSHEGLGEQMFDFAKLLLFVSFGYSFIAFYEAPLPGIGVSFSNLITDQAALLPERARGAGVRQHLPPLRRALRPLLQPDAWSILANLIYWTVLLLIAFAKALSLGVIAFGLIATRGLRAARPHLRAVLHRPEARLAVLGLAASRSSSTRSSRSSPSRS